MWHPTTISSPTLRFLTILCFVSGPGILSQVCRLGHPRIAEIEIGVYGDRNSITVRADASESLLGQNSLYTNLN